MGCLECLAKVPYASLIATIICCVGVGVFCGTLYPALRIVVEDIFINLLGFSVPWLKTTSIFFIVVALCMALFAILLLIFGFLATGSTRKNVYKGTKCIMGGRVSAAVFMFICYLLNIVWVCVSAVLMVPILMYVILNMICVEEVIDKQVGWYPTINISHYGIFRNATAEGGKNIIKSPTELNALCQHVAEAGPLFVAALVGSILIVLGMVTFFGVNSANFVRIQLSKEVQEMRDDLDMTIQNDFSSTSKF